jgi:hypothetical protein
MLSLGILKESYANGALSRETYLKIFKNLAIFYISLESDEDAN